jgi:hypothetical protein
VMQWDGEGKRTTRRGRVAHRCTNREELHQRRVPRAESIVPRAEEHESERRKREEDGQRAHKELQSRRGLRSSDTQRASCEGIVR